MGKTGRKEGADATDTVSGASNKVNKESPFDKLTPALSRGALLFPSAGTSSWRRPRGIKRGTLTPGTSSKRARAPAVGPVDAPPRYALSSSISFVDYVIDVLRQGP